MEKEYTALFGIILGMVNKIIKDLVENSKHLEAGLVDMVDKNFHDLLFKMNKYEILKNQLETTGTGKMKAFGNSMLPILKSGSLLTFQQQDKYEVGDIVFCKVKGRWIDAHKITKIDAQKGYLISNNHGFDNGWTHTIFGKAIQSEFAGTIKTLS